MRRSKPPSKRPRPFRALEAAAYTDAAVAAEDPGQDENTQLRTAVGRSRSEAMARQTKASRAQA